MSSLAPYTGDAMPPSFVDRLHARVAAGSAPVCVGLDPRLDALPAGLATGADPATRIVAFYREVLPAIAPHVPAVKPNVAFFERYGAPGFGAYAEVCALAQARGLLVIGDIKRGDIDSTAAAYAEFHLDVADAVTLHPLLGRDSLAPFLKRCATGGKAIFVLVRTSNASAVEVQGLRLEGGGELSEALARAVDAWGHEFEGEYAPVGAVVGATYPDELGRLRALMPRASILIPGVGAQGASVSDTLAAFDGRGFGGIVNQSRGVLQCFQPTDSNWLDQVRDAAQAFAREMRRALSARAEATGR